MITLDFFTYTDEQWNAIRAVVRDELGLDADQIEREVSRHRRGGSFTGMQPLRSHIEIAAILYRLHSAAPAAAPREVYTLREDAKNLRARIIGAFTVPLGQGDRVVHPLLRDGVDADMLTVTCDYFSKLLRNLDRQIEQAGSPGTAHARPPATSSGTSCLRSGVNSAANRAARRRRGS